MRRPVNVELEAEHELVAVFYCGTAKPDLVIQVGVDLRVQQLVVIVIDSDLEEG